MSIANKFKTQITKLLNYQSAACIEFHSPLHSFGMILGILILIELLSFLAWKFSVLNLICFSLILLITLILSLKKLEYGLYILFVELFIGSFGYLFSYQGISIRIGIFLIIIAVWLFKVLKHHFCHSDRPLGLLGVEESANSQNLKYKNKLFCRFLDFIPLKRGISLGMTKLLGLFGIVLIWAFAWGLIRGNNFGNVFLDFNNWLYFLLIFPVLNIQNKERFLKNILNVLIASVILICLKTLVLFYLFSHNYAEIMGAIYRWVRDTRIGEITLINGNFYRIFIPSQIYSLFTFFILLFLKFKNKIVSYISLTICLITIILSFSRSYWVGLCVGLVFYFIFQFKNGILNFFKKFAKVLIITIISLGIICLIFVLPSKTEGQDLLASFNSRATQGEAASLSRLAQLKPLSLAIVKHPVIGSGFGTNVTYISDDPRIEGKITTHAFEWGYLDMLLKFGLFGLVIYLYLIWLILKKLIFDFRFSIFNLGFCLALTSLLIVNIFSPYLNHPLGIGFIIICLIFTGNEFNGFNV